MATMAQRILLLVFLTVGILFCFASLMGEPQVDYSRRDGNWWLQQTVRAQRDYMTGFFDGMSLGHHFSYWAFDGHEGVAVEDRSLTQKTTTSFNQLKKRYLDNVTDIQVADGLTDFYKDYRNRKIEVPDAVWIVLNSISGKSQTEMEKLIENWRKNTRP